MTTTDKLSDVHLEVFACVRSAKFSPELRSMARELLAHRRASQAAPAPQKPVAWAETDHKGKVIGVSMNQYPWHPTPLYASPAPSDGLREALVRIAGLEFMIDRMDVCANKDAACMAIQIARAALAKIAQEG